MNRENIVESRPRSSRLPRKRGRTDARARAFGRVRAGSAALAARRAARRVPDTRSAPPRSGKETPLRRRSGPRSAALGFSIHPDKTHRRTLGSRFATSAVPCAGRRAESAVRAITYLIRGARDRAHGLSVGARERGAPGHLEAAAEEAGGATGGRASRLARDGRGGDGGDNRLARHRAGSMNGARCSGRKVRLLRSRRSAALDSGCARAMRASLWPDRAFADARGWRKIRRFVRFCVPLACTIRGWKKRRRETRDSVSRRTLIVRASPGFPMEPRNARCFYARDLDFVSIRFARIIGPSSSAETPDLVVES